MVNLEKPLFASVKRSTPIWTLYVLVFLGIFIYAMLYRASFAFGQENSKNSEAPALSSATSITESASTTKTSTETISLETKEENTNKITKDETSENKTQPEEKPNSENSKRESKGKTVSDSQPLAEEPYDPSPADTKTPQNNIFSTEIDQNTGALTYSYPIDVPPGRNEMTPDISLSYNSNAKDNDSFIGSGWSFNIPYIERINKTGVDAMYNQNYFYSSLSGELINIDGENFGSKVESGDFLIYKKINSGWEVTDKKGTKYSFGINTQNRQDNPTDNTKIYRWMLEEVRDTNNNFISYEYYKDAGQIYPSKITYSGHGTEAGIFTVNFVREARPSSPQLFNTGFAIKTNFRIKEINTAINTTWVRKYTLAYTGADNASVYLLNTITESGQDENGIIKTMPVIDLDYQVASTSGWTYQNNWPLPVAFINDNEDTGVRFTDVNGDGLTDIICAGNNDPSPCEDTTKIYLNTGSGWSLNTSWQFPTEGDGSGVEHFTDGAGRDEGLRLADVNGDGFIDMLRGDEDGKWVYINNKVNGWNFDSNWNLPVLFTKNHKDAGVRLTDINGDGLVDILCSGDGSGMPCRTNKKIYLNNGNTWILNTTWSFQNVGSFTNTDSKDNGIRFADVNGDGLVDILKGKNDERSVYLNNGINGWSPQSGVWILPKSFIKSYKDTGLRIADVNGDGLVDLACAGDGDNDDQCAGSNKKIYINTGTGWSASTSWLFPIIGGSGSSRERFVISNYRDNGLRMEDINGDGMIDFARGRSSEKYIYLNNTTKQTNLLTKITYPQGGNTEIIYKGISQFRDQLGNILNPKLPLFINAVSQITNNDGAGNLQPKTYQYENGLYYFSDYLNRKFAGFEKVSETDGAGNIKKTYFHQGNTTNSAFGEFEDDFSKIGNPYRIEELNNVGNLYKLTINKIDKENLGGDHNFVKLVRTTELTYDGNSNHIDRASEFEYDDYGNITNKTNWGKVSANIDGTFSDINDDDSKEEIDYTNNEEDYIVGLPSKNTLFDQNNDKVRETKIYYDDLSLGNVEKGNNTKTEQWIEGSDYIELEKEFNDFGLIDSSNDALGNTTTYTYDTYNLYPATVTNALSQNTSYLYDYSIGKPKYITDLNNFPYQIKYDGLDRILEERIPNEIENIWQPTVLKNSYTYTDTPNNFSIKATRYLDDSTSMDTYQYFDGLGRLIQERKEAETAGKFNVKNLQYNNLGLISKETLRFENTGSAKTSSLGDDKLHINYTYDALHRPKTISNIITGTTTYTYDDWKTTVRDANGKEKKLYKDAYDNLIKVEEGYMVFPIYYGFYTNYEWNLNKNLTKITDASGNIRNFSYDGLGRKLTAEDLHTTNDTTFGTWSYIYDNANNLIEVSNPNEQTINYTYDELNRLSTEDWTGNSTTDVSYTYDTCTRGIGRLCLVSVENGDSTSYTYNKNGNIINEIKVISGSSFVTSFEYDKQNNNTLITYPDLSQVKYTFNTAGLLEKIERREASGSFTNIISNFNYSPMDQAKTIIYANGVITTNTFDPEKVYRLTNKKTLKGSTKLQDLSYVYDNIGNITKTIDSSNTNTAKTSNYVYDYVYRITSATITGTANGQNYTQTFTYDPLGNILSGPEGAYLYQGNNDSNYANPHAATSINGVTYTYDNNGNLLNAGTLSNTWNYKNQLTQSNANGIISDYTYDHSGTRTSMTLNSVTTKYPNKFYNTNGAKKTKQIYAGKELVATIETSGNTVTSHYVHTDNILGSNVISNSSGVKVQLLDYFPFGKLRLNERTGSFDEQKKFGGHIYDDATGLIYMGARYYNGSMGRFISQDPVFWSPEKLLENPQSMNSYSYALNNPITNIDPDGRQAVGVGGGFFNSVWGRMVNFMSSSCIAPSSSTSITSQALQKRNLASQAINSTTTPATVNQSKNISVLNSPVGNAPISSLFKVNRDVCAGCSKVHGGTDYIVPIGTSVYATAPGKVVEAGTLNGFGKTIVINHGPTIADTAQNAYTVYSHGSELLVKRGQEVNTGDLIMYSGNTGENTTGPHLHYEVVKNSTYPENFYKNIDIRYGPSDLNNFLNQ